jgi:hypothetical protein
VAVKWPGHETGHLSPSGVEVKIGGALPPLPHVFMAWYLIKLDEDFTLTLTILLFFMAGDHSSFII